MMGTLIIHINNHLLIPTATVFALLQAQGFHCSAERHIALHL